MEDNANFFFKKAVAFFKKATALVNLYVRCNAEKILHYSRLVSELQLSRINRDFWLNYIFEIFRLIVMKKT